MKKKKDFDDKLKSLTKKVTSNKTRHIELNNKLDELKKKKLKQNHQKD